MSDTEWQVPQTLADNLTALANRPSTPDGIAVTVVSEWYASETRITLAASKRESLIMRITKAIQTDRKHHAANVQQARINALITARNAMCYGCRRGLALQGRNDWSGVDHKGDGKYPLDMPCTALAIRDLIKAEAASE
jgi:hypothetical protein